jgi:hypothetical protein
MYGSIEKLPEFEFCERMSPQTLTESVGSYKSHTE